MRVGKLPEAALVRSVLRMRESRREDVTAGPAVGSDYGAFYMEQKGEVIASMAPFSLFGKELAPIAVHSALNGVEAAGARPAALLAGLLLPEGMEEAGLRELMRLLDAAAGERGAEIIGGHTETVPGIASPILTVTGIGKRCAPAQEAQPPGPGLELVVTKHIGLAATAFLAKERKERLGEIFSPAFIREAELAFAGYSIGEECRIALEQGAAALHDVSRGGIFGALWELAERLSVGLSVDVRHIPVRQETVELCEVFRLNPYQILSTGSLLAAVRDGEEFCGKLLEAGIDAAVIGRTTPGRERILQNGGEIRYLDKPQMDELYRLDPLFREPGRPKQEAGREEGREEWQH